MSEKFGRSYENEILGAQLLRAAEKKASEAEKQHSMDMKPFMELYGKEKVLADYQKIADRMKNHRVESDAQKIGSIFEGAFLDLSNRGQWFGMNSEVVRASRFDDIMNGIDMVVTLIPENGSPDHLELGSDLTFSSGSLQKKLDRIKDEIHVGRLATIKYFHSPALGFTGQMANVPRCVVGLGKEHMPELVRSWVHEPEAQQQQFGSLFNYQMQIQMEAFRKLAESEKGRTHAVTRAYDRSASLLGDIVKNAPPDQTLLNEDWFTEQLTEECRRLS